MIRLLCLANFSVCDAKKSNYFRLESAYLTNSLDYYNRVIKKKMLKLKQHQLVFHDLEALSPDMNFNMNQIPGIVDFLKKCVSKRGFLYISSQALNDFKKDKGIQDFELTIFYYFERKCGDSKIKTRIHNVLIVNSVKPIVLFFDPFRQQFIHHF